MVEASSLKELFGASLSALAFLLSGSQESQEKLTVKRKLFLQADNFTNLLIDFLSQALTYAYLDQAVYEAVKISQLTACSCQAVIYGRPVSSFSKEIKAVTYHEAQIKKIKKGIYQTILVFDL